MDIIKFVCAEGDISEEDFFSKCRKYEFVRWRVAASNLLFDAGYIYSDIVSMMKKHKETIRHHRHIHESYLTYDKVYRETYNNILEKLKEDRII